MLKSMEGQSELSVISWVSAVQGCPLKAGFHCIRTISCACLVCKKISTREWAVRPNPQRTGLSTTVIYYTGSGQVAPRLIRFQKSASLPEVQQGNEL